MTVADHGCSQNRVGSIGASSAASGCGVMRASAHARRDGSRSRNSRLSASAFVGPVVSAVTSFAAVRLTISATRSPDMSASASTNTTRPMRSRPASAAFCMTMRPERLNALGGTLREDVTDGLTRAIDDPDVRVIVITGAGKGFCAGGDVKAMQDANAAGRPRPLDERVAPSRDRTVLLMRDSPKPLIAAVNGAAAGAGMNLALACDIRLASSAAKFSQAFVRRGLHPDWGGTYFLPRVVGMAKACEMIFTGELIDANEALRLGIVSTVHPPERLLPATYELAAKIAQGPPIAIRLARRALYRNLQEDLRSALEFETFAQNICADTDDAREGIRAFVEKREPKFTGR